jgi:protein-disulfide isomerase
LASDLKDERPEGVEWRELVGPGPGTEVWPRIDESGENRIGFPEELARSGIGNARRGHGDDVTPTIPRSLTWAHLARHPAGTFGTQGRTLMASTDRAPVVEPLDEQVDHVRGEVGAPVILEYGDYECPYSRQAFRVIERVERELSGRVRFAFRHFPLTQIHPHAFAASSAAEAATQQDRFWEMHDLLFHRQKALEDDDLRAYAGEIGLDLARFDQDRGGDAVIARIDRDVASGDATGLVHGTPTIFIDGVLYQGGYEPAAFIEALAR